MRLSAPISVAGWLSLLAVLVGLTATAAAQAAVAPRSEIAPFVDDITIAIARVDLNRIDSDAAANWEAKYLHAIESDLFAKALPDLPKLVPQIRKWATEFVRAGGKTLYVTARLNEAAPAYAIVPLEAGADPKVLGEMLKDPLAGSLFGTTQSGAAPPPPLAMLKWEVIGTTLYFGPDEALADLHHFVPASRPELEEAFAEAGNAPVRVAFSLPGGLREMLDSAKKLPREFGGGPVTPISSGLRWVSLALNTPTHETLSLSVTIQATDAANAEALGGIAETFRQTMAKEEGKSDKDFVEFLSIMSPKATSDHPDQLRLMVDDTKTRQVLSTFAGAIQSARGASLQSRAIANIAKISRGILKYADAHDGVLPKDLQADLKPYLGANAVERDNALVNPRQPSRKDAYVYIRPARNLKDLRNTGEIPMVYEAFDEWGSGIDVGYADGHAEFFRDRDEFYKALKNNPNVARGAELP